LQGAAQFHGLLEEGVQKRMAGSVGGITGAVERMSSKRALGYFVFAGPGKGATEMFHLDDGARRVAAEYLYGILVAKEIGALDGVVNVGFDRVTIDVRQGRGDTTLGGPGMAPARVHLRHDRHVEMASHLARGAKPGQPGSNYQYIV